MDVERVLLVALGSAARRDFGSGVALETIAFLAINPTVAAHVPVVMTDLPVSLFGASAVLLTIPAFRGWKLDVLIAFLLYETHSWSKLLNV